MTMAAVAFMAFTSAISASVRAATSADSAVSPLGPLLRTLPSIAASASSTCFDTPGSSDDEDVVAALHPAVASAMAARATVYRNLLFIGILQGGGGYLQRRKWQAVDLERSCC